MKKFFTLIALFAVALGAKAEWVEDYKIDYSSYTGFPFYVMGYVPEWFDGVMTDFGSGYKYVQVTDDAEETSDVIVTTQGGVEYYKIALSEPGWHQYFIADGISTELDGNYTVKAMVKASEACTIDVSMGWGWGDGQSVSTSVSIGTEWEEVEWEYNNIGGTSCNLVAKPGTVAATIEWKSVTVSHNQKEQRPVEWIEDLKNGDAEAAWPAWSLEETDGINANWRGDRTGEICAWALTMGRNFDDQNTVIAEDSPRARPYPADIEAEPGNESNHVFAVHMTQIDKIDDDNSIQWSNQFWIQSPQGWKSGTQIKLHFRYKAEKPAKAATQIHRQNPSNYLHWEAIGDINFDTEWQEFDKILTFSEAQGGGWSVAFNLCAESTVEAPQEPNVFYLDDLSWQHMKLDEGLFVASSNSETGIEYDFDNATEFVYDEDAQAYVATVGTKGKEDTWVNEIMISTIRGNDAAFKGATLKPSGDYIGEDNWGNYTESSLAKIKLPAAGVWTIYVDTENKQINLIKVEGEEDKKPIEFVPNETLVVVHGQERDFTSSEQPEDKENGIEAGTGQPWDNQFFLYANRNLSAGETTVLTFRYKSSVAAKTATQCHGEPGAYMHWAAIGDVNFDTEWQDFEQTFTVPSDADGMRSIAFNMAEIKEACDYEMTDFIWKLEDETESLIDFEGAKNFYVKEGAGTNPYIFGTDPDAVISIKSNVTSGVTYNLVGQRVNKNYKGIVVKNGRKSLVK
ncbi:MAG: hypothetical protein IJT75_04095 [Bacteroidaceae bacterium]|nr:hypothetical protein [Bacteroidaceae bacterium]